MNPLLLLADPVQTETLPVTQIIIEYVVYAAIIVVGILILLLIRRKMRLPRHADLRKMLTDFTALLAAFSKTAVSLPRLKYLKNISNLLYRLDKLIYTADRMAEKERDGELESISLLLGQARAEIAAYKFGIFRRLQPHARAVALAVFQGPLRGIPPRLAGQNALFG